MELLPAPHGVLLAHAPELMSKTNRSDQDVAASASVADVPPAAPLLTIADVERDTGLGKDTLRAWERRYGFPMPQRDARGDRLYPAAQVLRLRRLKRLVDTGHRPGRLVSLDDPALEALEQASAPVSAAHADVVAGGGARPDPEVAALLALLQSHDLRVMRERLRRRSLELGLPRFVLELLAPLTARVGESWMHGSLQVYEEHLYTELVQNVLRAALLEAPSPAVEAAPHVLLATVPGEPHGLGLLMAEALLLMQGARPLSLGPQAPLWDIASAAKALRCHVVLLAFSGCQPGQRAAEAMEALRGLLPVGVELWAGGPRPALRRVVAGVHTLTALGDLAPAVDRWRSRHPRAA